jgi:lysophospholipase L1-like esterase
VAGDERGVARYVPEVTNDRRRWLCMALCLLGALGCGKARSSNAAPAGGDGKAELARLDRSHPRAGVLVVIGSSTAAGVGASKPELAWVPRYRADLARQFPQFAIVNLAVGGYTTFHVQPASHAPAPGRPAPVPAHNIDAALALQPHGVIVNLPSNDQAAGYAWSEQLANYERIAAAAAGANVQLWVTTTQPRNLDVARRRELLAARDALRARFASRALDFWSPLARPDGSIKAELDAGDGTHVNDAGHALLARVVSAAGIPEALLAARD